MDDIMRMRVILEDDATPSAITASKSIDAIGASATRANPKVAALNSQVAATGKKANAATLFSTTTPRIEKPAAAAVSAAVAPAQAEAAAGIATLNAATQTLSASALIAQKSLDLLSASTLKNTETILANVAALNLQAAALKGMPTAKTVKAATTVNAAAEEVAARRAAKNMAVNAATQEVAALRVATAQKLAAAKVATSVAAQEAAQARAAKAALELAAAQEIAAERVAAANERAATRIVAAQARAAKSAKSPLVPNAAIIQQKKDVEEAARVEEIMLESERKRAAWGKKTVAAAAKSRVSAYIPTVPSSVGLFGDVTELNTIAPKIDKVSHSVKESGEAAAGAQKPFYAWSVAIRSVVSSATVKNLQGAIYFPTLIGRALTGAAAVAGILATSFVLAGVAFTKLLSIGAKAEGITTVFDNMTRSAGLAGNALLERLTAASHGAIAQVDLMKVANRALIAGGADIANSLPRLLEIARASSVATGQDMGFAYDSLIKGIVRASPKLIDNADIYLKIGNAVGEYAASIGKTVPQLSAQERQIAVLNAVLREGDKFITQMGLSGELASERIASLPAALKNVGAAFGEMAVQSGAAVFFSNLADSINANAEIIGLRNSVRLLKDELASIKTAAAVAELKALKKAELELYSVRTRTPEEWVKFISEIERRVEKTKELVEAEKRSTDMRYDAIQSLREQQFALAQLNRPISDVATALQIYADAAQEAITSSSGLGPIATEWAKLYGDMQGLATVKIEPPKLGATALGTDTAQLRQNIALFSQLYPKLYAGMAEGGLGLEEAIAPIEKAQMDMVLFAGSLETPIERLNALAISTYGAGASAEDFVSKWDDTGKQAQAWALQFGLLDFALANIVERTKAPVTLKMQVEGFSELSKGIDQMLLAAADFMPYDELLRLQEQYTQQALADWTAFNTAYPNASKLQLDIQAALYTQFYQGQLDAQTAYAKQATDIASQLAKLTENPLPARKKQPGVGATLLTTDIGAWRSYADSLRAIYPAATTANIAMDAAVKKMEEAQQAAIVNAEKMGWTAEAFDVLGQAAFGVGGDLTSLVTRFNELGGSAAAQIPGIKALSLVIQKLHDDMLRPFALPVDDMSASFEEGAKSIQGAVVDLSGVFSNEKLATLNRNMLDQFTADWQVYLKTHSTATMLERDLWVKQELEKYTGPLEGAKQYHDALENMAKQANKDIKASADETRSGIEAAFKLDLDVTAADMLATKAGTYEDAALESARRLNAIAERGREELAKHADWASALKIPPDILAGSEEGLKAWAAKTSQDVQNLTRPDLINWDAFLSNWDQGLLDEAAKSRTMDQALEMLVKSGRVGPEAKAAAKKKIEEMFGAGPEITFASFFPEASTTDLFLKAAFDSIRDKANKIQVEMEVTAKLKGASPLEQLTTLPPAVQQQLDQYDKLRERPPSQSFNAVPAEVKQQIALYEAQQKALQAQKTVASLGVIPPEVQQMLAQYDVMRKQPLAAGMPTTQTPGTWPTTLPPSAGLLGGVDMTKAGQDSAEMLNTAFITTLQAKTPGTEVATAWNTNFASAAPMFAAIGNSAGNQVGDATVSAILNKVGGVVQKMAQVIAPEVAAILGQKGNGSLP